MGLRSDYDLRLAQRAPGPGDRAARPSVCGSSVGITRLERLESVHGRVEPTVETTVEHEVLDDELLEGVFRVGMPDR